MINKKNIFSGIVFIFSLILISYFITKVDIEKFKLLFLNLSNPLFICSYLICIIQTLLNAKKFKLLFVKNLNNRKLISIFFTSSFLNFILPFKLGEVKKIYLLKKYFNINYLKNIELVIVDKIFEVSFYIIFSIFIFSFLKEIKLIFIISIVLVSSIYLLFSKKIIFYLSKKKIKFFKNLKSLYLKYTTNFINIRKIIITNMLIIFLTFIHFKIFFSFLNIEDFSYLNLISFVSLISIVSFIPLTYNGLGFREFFILIIFGQIFTIEQIILISVFFISRSIPSAIIGIGFFIENLTKK